MADHGGVDYRQNPMLMVKAMNNSADFRISSAPISYDDLLNTMLWLATRMIGMSLMFFLE